MKVTTMRKLTYPMPPAGRWWMTAFFTGVLFSAAGSRFPDAMPWSSELPDGTQAVLRLCAGIVLGMTLQAIWWAARRTTRRV
jgi:hypothetical protein